MLKKVIMSDLGEIYTGNTPSKKNNEYYESNDIMFIKPDIMSFDIENIVESNEYISEKARDKARIVPANSLLVSCIGNIGKLAINKEEVSFNQQINAIVHNENIVSSKYLAYLLKYNQKRLESIANAPVVPIINKTQFSNFEVLIHESLETQKKIVEVLDKAQELIDKRKKQIEALDELVKSMFIEMFGDSVINTKNWNIRKLGELGYFKNGMNYKQSDSGFNIKFLGVGEFKYGNIINNSDKLSILELQEKPNDEYLLKDGDIVFVRSNGSKELVGRSVLIRRLKEDTTYSGFCIRYRNQSNEVTPEFLINLFSDEGFKSYFKKDSRGANINNLNQQMLSSLNIILPPIELQNQFADFVKQVDKLKFEMESSLKQLEDNFNSLMQRAFKGELF